METKEQCINYIMEQIKDWTKEDVDRFIEFIRSLKNSPDHKEEYATFYLWRSEKSDSTD